RQHLEAGDVLVLARGRGDVGDVAALLPLLELVDQRACDRLLGAGAARDEDAADLTAALLLDRDRLVDGVLRDRSIPEEDLAEHAPRALRGRRRGARPEEAALRD